MDNLGIRLKGPKKCQDFVKEVEMYLHKFRNHESDKDSIQ
jgi:hypothetical protein